MRGFPRKILKQKHFGALAFRRKSCARFDRAPLAFPAEATRVRLAFPAADAIVPALAPVAFPAAADWAPLAFQSAEATVLAWVPLAFPAAADHYRASTMTLHPLASHLHAPIAHCLQMKRFFLKYAWGMGAGAIPVGVAHSTSTSHRQKYVFTGPYGKPWRAQDRKACLCESSHWRA